ncbi:MAG TPA: cytochrome c [Chitinophagaceae bacterium]|nr:cytochrome c [Chitinophagaceae bacterium]
MKTHAKYKLLQVILVVAFVSADSLFAGCRDESKNPTADVSSSDTTYSKGLKHFQDTSLINQGRLLFQKNCGSCHNVEATDNYLKGVVQRVGLNYLKLYLTKQDSLIKSKEEYALELKRRFGNLASVHNFEFSDEQLNAIIAYLKKYSN